MLVRLYLAGRSRRNVIVTSSKLRSLVVNVPVQMACNQWTQFEGFPRFMEGVESVRQLSDTRLHWRATIGGKSRSGTPRSQNNAPMNASPGQAAAGTRNTGVVTFPFRYRLGLGP
jgi:uncharacterized membrane protein